ncbi:MAG: ATP-binding protein [Acidobacteriota bacterium]
MTIRTDEISSLPLETITEHSEKILKEIQDLVEQLKVPGLEPDRYREMIQRVSLLSVEVTQFLMCRLRTHLRLSLHYPICVVGTDAGGAPFTVTTVTENLSQGGACITLNCEIKPGQPLILFAQGYPERGIVGALVRWVLAQNSQWRVGIEFFAALKEPLLELAPVAVDMYMERGAMAERKADTSCELNFHKMGFAHLFVHDLKGPLAAIQGSLETLGLILQRYSIQDQAIDQLLAAGADSCQTILRLVNDLLDLAKFDSQGIMVQRQPLKIANITQAAITEVNTLALQKQIVLTENVSPDLPIVFGDSKLLIRALVNLLTNAVKFTDSNGRVELDANLVAGRQVDRGRNFLVLSVTDTGEGMAPEDVPYAFDLYWQSAAGQARGGGNGIGLAMVKRIAAAHGGNVSVRSNLGIGSTFSIILPVQQEA